MNPSKFRSSPALMLACSLALVALPAAFANKDHLSADEKFNQMDTDGDGQISRAEHAVGAQQMFARMDANHDGIVTFDEMDAKWSDKKADKHRQLSASEKISKVDQNNDGQLTSAEHASSSDLMFDKMDTNRDGYLSRAELSAGHDMMKKGK